MTHKCYFVPKQLIEKLPTKKKIEEQKGIDDSLRDRRKNFLKHPVERNSILAVMRKKTTHKEVRRLFDSKNSYNLTDEPIITDTQTHSSAPSANDALQLANLAYDFFHDKFHQESFDGKNSPIDIHINYGKKYNNAFYDGLQLVFGNGDGKYFRTFLTIDILMHELTHAVTDHNCGLVYENQPGALNEHLSDVFAMALKQRRLRERASQASWVVGEGIFTGSIKGNGIRTFKNEPAFNDPVLGLDDQPKHMDNYMDLPNSDEGDYGGVHINSGIPNRAFYEFCLMAEKEVSDEWVNRSWKAPLEIWFDTYRRINPNTDFRKFAYATVRATKSLHPQLQTQILKAWESVGIKV